MTRMNGHVKPFWGKPIRLDKLVFLRKSWCTANVRTFAAHQVVLRESDFVVSNWFLEKVSHIHSFDSFTHSRYIEFVRKNPICPVGLVPIEMVSGKPVSENQFVGYTRNVTTPNYPNTDSVLNNHFGHRRLCRQTRSIKGMQNQVQKLCESTIITLAVFSELFTKSLVSVTMGQNWVKQLRHPSRRRFRNNNVIPTLWNPTNSDYDDSAHWISPRCVTGTCFQNANFRYSLFAERRLVKLRAIGDWNQEILIRPWNKILFLTHGRRTLLQ